MIVNRYILKDFMVSDADIINLQNFAKILPAVNYFDKMARGKNSRIISVPHYKTSELITALEVYKKNVRADGVPKASRLIKILEEIK